jgi:site-specific DNA-methyltransferase (adenine-specific)/modification methylase
VKPYWSSPDRSIVVFNARWEAVLAAGVIPVREVALVHADPPTGEGLSDTRRNGLGAEGEQCKRAGALDTGGRTRLFEPIEGDFEPFDPAPLLALARPTVMWCAMHFADKLPTSRSWLLWDKREDRTPDDNADGELAWSNLGGPLRIFRHWWRGALRKTEKEDRHLHPTQKPIALSSWVFARAKLKRGDLVLVPYGGSGPDLPACRAMGLRCIWIECVESYCAAAVSRLGAVTSERAAEPVGPLFARGAT